MRTPTSRPARWPRHGSVESLSTSPITHSREPVLLARDPVLVMPAKVEVSAGMQRRCAVLLLLSLTARERSCATVILGLPNRFLGTTWSGEPSKRRPPGVRARNRWR